METADFINLDGSLKEDYVLSNENKIKIQIEKATPQQLLDFQQYFNSFKEGTDIKHVDLAMAKLIASKDTFNKFKEFSQGVISFNDLAICTNTINDIEFVKSFEEVLNILIAVIFIFMKLPKKKTLNSQVK